MNMTYEGSPDMGDNPETFAPEDLVSYLYSQFEAAFTADRIFDDQLSDAVRNGRFTHEMPTGSESDIIENAWRIKMQPPEGNKRGPKAHVYLVLDPPVDVMASEKFVPRGRLYIRERIGHIWQPLVLVDEVGATQTEEVEVITVDDFLGAKKEQQLSSVRRAKEIFDRLSRYNFFASVS